MFSSTWFQRGSAQTVLPPNNNLRSGRLCASYDEEIKKLKSDELLAGKAVLEGQALKRKRDDELKDLQGTFRNLKRKRDDEERKIMPKQYKLKDLKSFLADRVPASDADELHQEKSKLHEERKEQQTVLEKLEIRVNEAGVKAEDLDVSVKNKCESLKLELEVISASKNEIETIKQDLLDAEMNKKHYQEVMDNKVIPEIKQAEMECWELENEVKKHRENAPQIEVEELGWKESKPEQLEAELIELKEKHTRESRRFPESSKDLSMIFKKKRDEISRKQKTYKVFKEKLEEVEKALEMRRVKFYRIAQILIRQLTWNFNGHLKKKGIAGVIEVNAEAQTLSIKVTMPQDASNSIVRDTRGLSGGERSFSTLCFALTLHGMTEAPFHAMDEFDVFMDAVSRKISLDALVDFALENKSQWIFITPHDISMVKNHERIRKQQMAAPRG